MAEQCFYAGPPLEAGETSIRGHGAAPYVRKIKVEPGMKVLDYGAGKFARNADYLRKEGAKVYAYDPFNGKPVDGWKMGNVSIRKPRGKFDLVFTAYVLNVVPKYIELDIIETCRSFGGTQLHITRDTDIFVTVKNAMKRGDPTTKAFVEEFYVPQCNPGLADKPLAKWTDAEIMDLCRYGVQTSKGFQRIPFLEDEGFKQIRRQAGKYKVFEAPAEKGKAVENPGCMERKPDVRRGRKRNPGSSADLVRRLRF